MRLSKQVEEMENELKRYKEIDTTKSVIEDTSLSLYKYVYDECELVEEGFVLGLDEEDAKNNTRFKDDLENLTVEHLMSMSKFRQLFVSKSVSYSIEDCF